MVHLNCKINLRVNFFLIYSKFHEEAEVWNEPCGLEHTCLNKNKACDLMLEAKNDADPPLCASATLRYDFTCLINRCMYEI